MMGGKKHRGASTQWAGLAIIIRLRMALDTQVISHRS